MLDVIRKKKESIVIKAVFVIIVFSFIGTIFLVWGKGEDGFGTRGDSFAAKVGRTTISMEQYQNSYQQLRDIYQQVFGVQGLPAEVEKKLNIRQQAIDRLIDTALLSKGAKELGVTASKDEIAASIAAMPAFQRNGQFDIALYRQTLKASRITPKDFETSQKSDIMITKARKAIMNKATVSDDEAKARYHRDRDRIELSYASFGASELTSEIKPTQADLEEHLKKNSDKFKTTEKVAISYILLDPSPMAASQTVTDEEIQKHFKLRQDRWPGKELKDVHEQVRLEAQRNKAAKLLYEKAADNLYQNIKSGNLKLIAGKLGAKTTDTELFEANRPPQTLSGETTLLKKAFELKAGELGGPIETTKGIYILQVREKKPSELMPLAQVRSTVEQQFKGIRAAELAKQKAAEAQKQLGTTNHSGLKLQATPPFGYNPKGDIPSIGVSVPLMESAFKLTTASPAPSEPILIGNRWYAFRLKSRSVTSEADFASMKEEIKKQILPAKQEESIAAWLKEQKAKTKITINETLKTAQ